MDYKTYNFSLEEMIQMIFKSACVTVVIAILFYRSAWALPLGIPIFVLLYKRSKSQRIKERSDALQEQFLSGMRVLNSSLQAGLSMENSWKEVQKELALMYEEDAYLYEEVKELNHQVLLNIPIEKLLLEFAYRTQLEDIIDFAEVLDYAKRTGGNWKKIIDSTVNRMCEKQTAMKEIEVMVAAKKMEQRVMNLIPLGILAFLQFSSWDYMSVLYHNPLGVICMSVCLAGYVGALVLSEKILKIQV